MKDALRLILLATIVAGCVAGCGNSSSTSPEGTKSPGPKDSSNGAGYFSKISVTLRVPTTGYGVITELKFDSAGTPMKILRGDSLLCNGYSIKGYDSLHVWDDFPVEVIDSGVYVFTLRRHLGDSVVSASFTIPLPPFRITAPAEDARVSYVLHQNDTVVYAPAGGLDVIAFYAEDYGRYVENQNEEPDSGRYVMLDMRHDIGSGPGYLFLIRHLAGALTSNVPFKRVDYDIHQSSRHVNVDFEN